MAAVGPAAIAASDSLVEVPGADVPTPGRRIVDRLDPRIVNVLTVLGFGLPVLGYFWLVGRYSVNVIVGDQFDDVTVIGHTYGHLFDWNVLWAQHNENRIFFPNLIVVLLARTTHFNVQVEEYLSAIMLLVATTLLIWAHKRRSPTTPWLYYCPVALLGFSVVQYENALWGFQMAWYLVLLSLAVTVVLLDRATLTWLVFAGALGAAVVGSFSSLQGLLIWPAGLVLLYFHNFSYSSSSPILSISWHHPSGAVRFFFFAVGEVVGFRVDRYDSGNGAVSLLGLVIVVLAVSTVVIYGIRRDPVGGSPIGVALIGVGLLFAVSIAEGRSYFGYAQAGTSRYSTFDLLVPIGIYLALLGRPHHRTSSQPVSHAETRRRPIRALDRWVHRTGIRAARWAIVAVIVLQIPLGLHYGLQAARQRYVAQEADVQVLRHFDHASAGAVAGLYPGQPLPFIRQQVRVAETYHLSVFADTNRGR